ncbi:CWF19-like protein 1 [Hondaea fermentalgiana]|uniref:CWF19-like protein 1 n=1 Tax=Hondaea fermentalgiana TaxID=2315210 RepID=A0A2R5GHE5_9STRA|nr:CWF19-like protein 1 [Hondaea fermentalgiana]|eukprot:GBG30005.1 CWF19-like protein 1 [Hondaea fermentalgiana]
MVKVLFAGDVRGRLGALAEKVEALNASKHGPFDAVFCAGEFFADPAQAGAQGPTEPALQDDAAASSTAAAAAAATAADNANAEGTVDIESFIEGTKHFPVPAYFVAGRHGHANLNPDGVTLATNLHFLGRCGIKTISALDDLKIAFISGSAQRAHASSGSVPPWQYTPDDVEALASLCKAEQPDTNAKEAGASPQAWAQPDILLSLDWPKDLLLNLGETQQPSLALSHPGSEHVRTLSIAIAPRYHFAGAEGIFFARAPFRNGLAAVETVMAESDAVYTRFIALGRVDPANKNKSRKWLHALSLEPQWKQKQRTEPEASPDLAPCPFAKDAVAKSASVRQQQSSGAPGTEPIAAREGPQGRLTQAQIDRLHAQDAAQSSQYFFGSKRKRGDPKSNRKKRQRRRRHNVAPRADCWYCLASPSCESHLIVSVADEVYLSLPKGGLSAQHVQIVPIGHEESFAAVESITLEEALKFKHAVASFYASFDCVPLFFERNVILTKAMQRHAFLEAIPLPLACTPTLLDALKREADRCKISFDEELPDLGPKDFPDLAPTLRADGLLKLKARMADSDEEYMYIEVPGIVSPRIYMVPEDPDHVDDDDDNDGGDGASKRNVSPARKNLPLQFGRHLACSIMGCMHRVSWQDCLVPQDLETRMATAFTDGFKAFDPFQEHDEGKQE